jgi:hypothetical protein
MNNFNNWWGEKKDEKSKDITFDDICADFLLTSEHANMLKENDFVKLMEDFLSKEELKEITRGYLYWDSEKIFKYICNWIAKWLFFVGKPYGEQMTDFSVFWDNRKVFSFPEENVSWIEITRFFSKLWFYFCSLNDEKLQNEKINSIINNTDKEILEFNFVIENRLHPYKIKIRESISSLQTSFSTEKGRKFSLKEVLTRIFLSYSKLQWDIAYLLLNEKAENYSYN